MDSLGEKERPSIDLDDLAPYVEDEDCDEDLDLTEIDTRTWLVKIPKFLSERWSQHAQMGGPGVDLGRMRVYNSTESDGSGKIEIILPEVAGLPSVPTHYTLDVRNRSSTNLYAFEELARPEPVTSAVKPEEPTPTLNNRFEKPRRVRPKVARRPKVTGTIAHECLVSPVNNDSYRAVLRARQLKAAQPKRTIKRVNQDVATLNRMASGIATHAQASKFAALTRSTDKPKASEKFARMPKTELMDALFAGFLRYQYWSMKSLRDQTKQPEAYLREVLSEIATLLKAGPYVGHWVLKPAYAELNRSNAAAKQAEAEAKAQAGDDCDTKPGTGDKRPSKMEEDEPGDDDDNFDDDDVDEDMEAII